MAQSQINQVYFGPVKVKLSERTAAVRVLDGVLDQIERQWPGIYQAVDGVLRERHQPTIDPPKAKFQFTLAAIAINLRATFDVFPLEIAKRLMKYTMFVFESHFPDPKMFQLITDSVDRYIKAWNDGLLRIENPAKKVSAHLYYNMGLRNITHTVGDRKYKAPDLVVIDYLSQVLVLFGGKWEAIDMKYELEEFPEGTINS